MTEWNSHHSTCLVHGQGKDNWLPLLLLFSSNWQKECARPRKMCELRALRRNASCARGRNLGMWLVSAHVRRLGFILKAVWNTEGYEAADDMVETSVG